MHGRNEAWRPRSMPPIRPVPHVPGPSLPGMADLGRMSRHHQRHAQRMQRLHQVHRLHRHGGRRRPPIPLIIVAGVVGVSLVFTVVTIVLGMLLVAGAVAAPVLLVVGATRLATRGRRRRRALGGAAAGGLGRGAPGPALSARAAVDPWPQARSRFAQLRSEYAAYECDALAVLRLPALADVSVASTARFVEAFAEAQALDADGPVPPEYRDRYVAAVDNAWRCWHAAREAAERIRLSNVPVEERSAVERVVRLLTTARDSDNDAERLVAYGRARTELARLERTTGIRLPSPAQAVLDNAYRGQLPA
jgi:hypothetical protein